MAEAPPQNAGIAVRIQQGELELEAKGIPEEVAVAAVRRISNHAWWVAKKVPRDLQERVWVGVFDDQWPGAEEWARNYIEKMGE